MPWKVLELVPRPAGGARCGRSPRELFKLRIGLGWAGHPLKGRSGFWRPLKTLSLPGAPQHIPGFWLQGANSAEQRLGRSAPVAVPGGLGWLGQIGEPLGRPPCSAGDFTRGTGVLRAGLWESRGPVQKERRVPQKGSSSYTGLVRIPGTLGLQERGMPPKAGRPTGAAPSSASPFGSWGDWDGSLRLGASD